MKTRNTITSILVISALLIALSSIAVAQKLPNPIIVKQPPSSVIDPKVAGKNYTHLMYIEAPSSPAQYTSPYPGWQTPASIACVYNLAVGPAGCNSAVAMANPTGGKGAIAIVDAYDDPYVAGDLGWFSYVWGLTPIKLINTPGPGTPFAVVYAPWGGLVPGSCSGPVPGPQPSSAFGTGWDVEESLDIEYAHAMAPAATLFLVEAQSNLDSDMYCAVTVAGNLVRAYGGGTVSMSWGRGEFQGENIFDSVFKTPNVVYVASSGDSPGTQYPSASPNVISVGGTTFATSPVTGVFEQEVTWTSSGGGLSFYESRPAYQNGVTNQVGTARGIPDVAALADPVTGAWIWDSNDGGWWIVGGTSLAAPLWAGIVNAAGSLSASSNAELTRLYNDTPHFGGPLNPITDGVCGPLMGYIPSASQYWHMCTGLGSPRTLTGK